jgi:hypothetical protein
VSRHSWRVWRQRRDEYPGSYVYDLRQPCRQVTRQRREQPAQLWRVPAAMAVFT